MSSLIESAAELTILQGSCQKATKVVLSEVYIRHRAAACGGTGGVSLGLVRSAGLLVCRSVDL